MSKYMVVTTTSLRSTRVCFLTMRDAGRFALRQKSLAGVTRVRIETLEGR